MVYEAIEANRVELYLYARKEIMYNERDFLKSFAKKNQLRESTVPQSIMLNSLSNQNTTIGRSQGHSLNSTPNGQSEEPTPTAGGATSTGKNRHKSAMNVAPSNNFTSASATKGYESLYNESPL